MFDGLKKYFHPNTVLGLQIDNAVIRAVEVSNSAGDPTIERMVCHEVSDPSEIAKELVDLFVKDRAAPEVIVTSIPTSRAIIREISLPLTHLKKIEKIIKFQAEPYLPYPIEDVVVDFFPPGPNRPILTVGVPKKWVSSHLDLLSEAGLESALVTLEDAALFNLFVHLYPEKQDRTVAIMHRKANEATIQVIRQKAPVLMRVVLDGAADFRYLKETLALYDIQQPDWPISEILLVGVDAADSHLAGEIEAFTGIPTSSWKPISEFKRLPAEMDDKRLAAMSISLGLAVGMMNASPKALDLRKEEFSIRTPFELKNSIVYALSTIVLLMGLLTFQTYRELSFSKQRYASVNRQIARVLTDTFKDVGTVIKGRELAQMEQMIAAGKSRYDWLENMTAGSPALDVLLVLTKTLADYRNVRVDNVSIEDTRVLLDGRTVSFQTVDSLKGKLETSSFFKAVKLVGAKMDSQDRMVRFGFHLEKTR